MKKLIPALCMGLAIAAASCAGDKKAGTAAATPVAEPHETSLNIRYVVLDSIYKNYTLAQLTASQAQTMAMELQSFQSQLAGQLQNQAAQIQKKAESNGYLTQASYEADMKALNSRQNAFQNQYAQREAKANQEMAIKQQALMDSINNFIIEFNKERKYDAILLKDAGLYFNPALDITDEVVDGLNARYKAPADAKADSQK